MMNDQGQYDSNESIQSEANHWESNEALGAVSSSSSCTGSTQSFPNSLNGPNSLTYQEHLNIIQRNDHGEGVIHRSLDLNAEYVKNDNYTNMNVSVGLRLHPFEPRAQDNRSDSNLSDSTANNSGRSYVVNGQGVANSSVNMSFSSSNRSLEHASRELLTGESSRSAVQARIPISQAATVQVNTSNSLNRVPPYVGAANIRPQQFHAEFSHETIMPFSNMQQMNEARHHSANGSLFSFEAGSDHGITGPVYDMLHFSHARQTGHFQSNNQTDASPLAFVTSNNFSMGHPGNFHALFPGQTFQYHQPNHPHFFSQEQASVGVIPYGQPFVQFPNFHEVLPPTPWVNVMRSRGVSPPFSPVYTMPGGGNPNNIPRNTMLNHQAGRGAQSPYLADLNFDHGTANFIGNFASHFHYGPIPDSHLLTAPPGVPWFIAFEHHMPMLFGVWNHSAAAPIGFPWPSRNNRLDLNPPAISRERDLATVINSAGFQNHLRTSQRYENQFHLNIGPPFTDEAGNNMLSEVRNVMQHLRNGVPMRTQELLIIDYSLLLYLPEDNNNEEDNDEQDEENWQAVPGLSEEDIMTHLRLEEFQAPTGVTPENVDSCCICQENYTDGEDIGVLDCRHRFHYDCVKIWLGVSNTCPICVRTGLAV